MNIQLEIPDEFVVDYGRDKFKNFFERVLADVEAHGVLCGNYEAETVQMLQQAFKKSKCVDEWKVCYANF